MNPLIRLGGRDLLRNRRFSLLFIANLALGLTGLLLIGSFGASLDRHLARHLKEMMTGDLMLQASRPLTGEETDAIRAVVGEGTRFSRQVALYTMIRSAKVSRLAHIVAIDENFPLYGDFRTDETASADRAATLIDEHPRVLMSRGTARSFGLAPGDQLTIGQTQFPLAALVAREPGWDFTRVTLAPRIYLGLNHLEATGLIRFGSRVSHTLFIRLPEGADGPAIGARLTARLDGMASGSPEVRVSTTADANRRMAQVLGYFTSFLSLAAMVSLALAGVAAAYLFREHLHGKLREIAILLSLGASRRQCLFLATGQLVLLGLAAASVAILLAWPLLPLFGRLLATLLPDGLDVVLDPATVVLTLLIGSLGSLFFCLPLLLRILQVRPLHLFQGTALPDANPGRKRLLDGAAMAPALLFLLFLALRLSHVPLQGLAFMAGLAGLVLVFTAMAALFFRACRSWSRTNHLIVRIAGRNLYRNRRASAAVFVSLATALLLLNLIPQIEKGLAEEIGQPEGLELPDLFLIDIQEQQRQPLLHFFQTEKAVLSVPTPMVQGRIVTINDQPFARWRELHHIDDERGLRRTEFNFSSRSQLDGSETVIEGPALPTTSWQPETGQPFALSMEREFSKRLRVGIGDRLVVDIQGIEMEGRIVNLRKVRWNSFQPNFFMLVQPGVLDDAPKSYLASAGRVEEADKDGLVNRLSGAFPNISVLDVSSMVDRLVHLTGRLTHSLQFMAALALATGLAAVVAIARQEAVRREREINLLRVLGAARGTIRVLVAVEFAAIAAAAALSALLLSVAAAWAVSWLMFDRIWQPHWQAGLLLTAAAVTACSLTALVAADSVIRRKPTTLLG